MARHRHLVVGIIAFMYFLQFPDGTSFCNQREFHARKTFLVKVNWECTSQKEGSAQQGCILWHNTAIWWLIKIAVMQLTVLFSKLKSQNLDTEIGKLFN